MTAALILAAGASTRLGHPKQLLILDRETLLDRTIRTAGKAGCYPILVTLGASADEIQQRCTLHRAEVLINEDWPEGMASSIRLSIAILSGRKVTGAIILPSDMPAITPAHLRALRATGETTASHYAGRNGIPAFFPAAAFPTLLTLTGDHGARDLLRDAPSLPLEGGELDIDTPEDVALLLHQGLREGGGAVT